MLAAGCPFPSPRFRCHAPTLRSMLIRCAACAVFPVVALASASVVAQQPPAAASQHAASGRRIAQTPARPVRRQQPDLRQRSACDAARTRRRAAEPRWRSKRRHSSHRAAPSPIAGRTGTPRPRSRPVIGTRSCCRNAAACSRAWSIPNSARSPNAARAIARTGTSQRKRRRRAQRRCCSRRGVPTPRGKRNSIARRNRWRRASTPPSCRPATSLRAWAKTHGDKATFPDGVHPSVAATLIMAIQFHEAIVGRAPQPVDVTLDFALLPANAAIKPDAPMESQAQLKGTKGKVVVRPTRSRRCCPRRNPDLSR